MIAVRWTAGVWMLVAAVAVVGCNPGTGSAPVLPELVVMKAAELRAVALTAALDLPLQMSVYAWRDFLPRAGAATQPHDLMISAQLRGGVVPPKTLTCGTIYLVLADSVFAARPAEQRAGDGPGAVECLLRGGPEWPVGAEIQVIISAGAGAQRVLIRRETTIDATS